MSAPLNASPARAEFDALVAQLAEVEAIPGDQTTNEHCDLAGELAEKIMAMPAPDAEALRWKLDYIMAPSDGGGVQAYTAEYAAQTIVDYRRMLTPDRADSLVAVLARAAGHFEDLRRELECIVSLAELLSTTELLDSDGRNSFQAVANLAEATRTKALSYEDGCREKAKQMRREA